MPTPNPNLDSLFLAALELTSAEARAAFLADACGKDDELRQQVERLLRSHDRARDFLVSPPTEVSAAIRSRDEAVSASLDAGLTPAFDEETAVVIGHVNHSVLRRLGNTLDEVPSVSLREPTVEQTGPVERPSSPEVPSHDSASRYRLDGEIARGGMGAILKGRDTDLGRDLAIKVLLDEHKDRPEVIQRFVEEAQIGGQLQHPGIAPVYELGQFADQRPFFSMKLVKGETLAKLLADRDQAGEERGKLLGIFEQICQTMAYAHSRGVIHRDLKPSNIMVGSFGEVQVMDWGLAKVLSSGGVADEKKSREQTQGQSVIETLRSVGSDIPGRFGSGGSETQMGSVMGTPAYMPPEQALGEIDNMDERADVFGLGAILCEILTGDPPYIGDDNAAIHRLASRGKLEDCFARLAKSGADAELVQLTKDCLKLEPVDRPRDAGVLAERVSGYLESVETKLRDAELARVAQVTKQEEEGKRRRVVLAFAASVILMIGLAGANWIGVERQNSKQQAEANEKLQRANTRTQAALEDQLLSSAFDAFHSGNTRQSMELLEQVQPTENTARHIAWRFLKARCDEQQPVKMPLPNAVSGELNYSVTTYDPLEQFVATVTASGEVVLAFHQTQRTIALSLDIDGEEASVPSDTRLTVSDDGQWILAPCAREEKGVVLCWKISRSGETAVVDAAPLQFSHEYPVVGADMDPTSQRLVSVDQSGTIKLWSLDGQQLLGTGKTKGGMRRSICFSPDGHWVLGYGRGSFETVHVHSTDGLEEAFEIPHGDRIRMVKRSPRGNSFAVAGYHGTEIWEIRDEKPIRRHKLSWRRSMDLAFSKDGRYLATAGADDRMIRVYDCDSGKSVASYTQYESRYRVSFIDRDIVANGAAHLLRFQFSNVRDALGSTQTWWYAPIAVSGTKIAFPDGNTGLDIWDLKTEQRFTIPLGEDTYKVDSIALSKSGDRLAVAKSGPRKPGGASQDVSVYDLMSRRQIYQLVVPSLAWTLRFSPINDELLFVSGETFTRLWDMSDGRTGQIPLHRSLAADFSPDGTRLFVGEAAWNVTGHGSTIWTVAEGALEAPQELPVKGGYSFVYKHDGTGYALLDGQTLRLFENDKETDVSPLAMRSNRILSVDYSPNDECLLVASPVGEMTFIDPVDGKSVGTFRLERPVRHVRFMDDINRIVASTMDGAILQWDY